MLETPSGIVTAVATIEARMKPATKPGIRGARVVLPPRPRSIRPRVAMTGASMSTRASLTITATVSTPPPMIPPAATT